MINQRFIIKLKQTVLYIRLVLLTFPDDADSYDNDDDYGDSSFACMFRLLYVYGQFYSKIAW